MSDKQSQKAGDNSQQLQADKIVVHNGIDEKRVREIFDELMPQTLQNYTDEATSLAKSRNIKFENKTIELMMKEGALEAFSDPSFQILLQEAQKRAASTEREPDYDLLSQLMLHRFKKGTNRNVRAGISRAVEIVDQISDEALLGLTALHSVSYFVPLSGKISVGLEVLDSLYGKLFYSDLPIGLEWLDHLDILDAIRISFGATRLLEEFWYEIFEGYVTNGIEKNSSKHIDAKNLLKKHDLDHRNLAKNEVADNYVKLELVNKKYIPDVQFKVSEAEGTFSPKSRKINEVEIEVFNKIYDMYDGTKMTKKDFISKIDQYPNLKKLREWWNQLHSKSIQVTSVGRVLAHSNAQRIDSTLPPLN